MPPNAMHRRDALALLAAGAAACSRNSGSPDSGAETVHVGIRPFVSTFAFYAGVEGGRFDSRGLDVQIHAFTRSRDTIAPLAAGDLDVSLTGLNPSLLSAIGQGAAIRVVAARDTVAPDCGSVGALCGRREAFPDGLDDVSALRGKTVSIQGRAILSEFYLDQHLESAGLTQDDLRVVLLRYPEASAALLSGNIDAMIYSHFEKDLAAESPDIVRGPGMADLHPSLQYNYVNFGARILNGATDVAQPFLRAYFEGVRDYRAGVTPQFALDFADKHGMDPEAIVNACRNYVSADGVLDLESIRLFTDWCARKGYLPEPVSAEQVVDTGFLERLAAG